MLFSMALMGCSILSQTQLYSFDHYTIKEETWQKGVYWSLADILEFSPDIWHRNPGIISQYQGLRFRGSELNHIKFLIDGMPVFDPWNHHSNIEWIPIGMLESIEIYPGMNPFGESAIGGVINFKTRSYKNKKPYTRFLSRSHLFVPNDTLKYNLFDINFGQWIFSNLHLYSGITIHKYSETFPGESLDADQLRARIHYKPVPKGFVDYQIFSGKSDNDFLYPVLVPGDTTALGQPHQQTKQISHSLQAQYEWGNWTHQIRYINKKQEHKVNDRSISNQATFIVDQKGMITTNTYHHNRWDIHCGFKTFAYQLRNKNDLFRKKQTESNLFLQLTAKPFETTHIQTQAQLLNNNTVDNPQYLGSISIHSFLWQNHSASLGFHQSARMPSLAEQSGVVYRPYPSDHWTDIYVRQNPLLSLASHDLMPESANTINFKVQSKLSHLFQMNLNMYYKRINDVILRTLSGDTATVFQNNGSHHFLGAGTEGLLNLPYGLQIRSVVNILNATDDSDNVLVERPTIWGQTGVTWGGIYFEQNLDASLTMSVHYFSDYFQYFYNPGTETMNTFYTVPGSAFLHVKTSLLFMDRTRFTFSFQNILGNRIEMINNLPMPEMAFRMGLTWDLYN